MGTGRGGVDVDVPPGFLVAGFSDTGRVRTENQDRWLALALPAARGCALIVADGMGGEADGATAAAAAAETAAGVVHDADVGDEALTDAVLAADGAVAAHRMRIGGAMCGTTLVLAVITPGHARIANVGDSRAYLVRGGSATAVTRDHSWVADEMRAGHLGPGSDRHHPRRNIITRAITGQGARPDLYGVEVAPGDMLLLCSDGVWEPLEDDRIAVLMAPDAPVAELAARICTAALDAGSLDNVTAVVCRIEA